MINIAGIVQAKRDPNTFDNSYNVNTLWQNTITHKFFLLVSIDLSKMAFWDNYLFIDSGNLDEDIANLLSQINAQQMAQSQQMALLQKEINVTNNNVSSNTTAINGKADISMIPQFSFNNLTSTLTMEV